MKITACLLLAVTPSLLFAQNVGIGNSSPAYKLHLSGGDLFVQSSTGSIILGYQGSNKWHFSTTNGGADLRMVSDDGTTITPRHYFSQNGNVGLAGFNDATTPAAPLHVRATVSEVIRVQGSNPYVSFHDNTDGYKGYVWYNGTDMFYGAATGAALKLTSNSTLRMTLNTDGRVSIGASNLVATGYLLSVDGKVIAEEMRVQLSGAWPDYVFDKNYKLPDLGQVEQFINMHQHLPGILPAKEMEKGQDLGDTQRRMLEKIEELTLYIIRLNKENRELKKRIEKIEASVKH